MTPPEIATRSTLSRILCCRTARNELLLLAAGQGLLGQDDPSHTSHPNSPSKSCCHATHAAVLCYRYKACTHCRHGIVWVGTTNTSTSQTVTTALQHLGPALQVMRHSFCCVPYSESACSKCSTSAQMCNTVPLGFCRALGQRAQLP